MARITHILIENLRTIPPTYAFKLIDLKHFFVKVTATVHLLRLSHALNKVLKTRIGAQAIECRVNA